MFSEYPQQLIFPGMEMPDGGELSNDTPHLKQLLAEIKQYKERQWTLKNSSPKAKVENKPSKPEARRHVSVLSAHEKTSAPVRQALLGKRITRKIEDEVAPGWLKAG